MKMPLVYVTAAWSGDPTEATEQAARYCRAVYEAGFSPMCRTWASTTRAGFCIILLYPYF